MEIISIISRFVHLGAMAALLGGTLYMVFAMRPAMKLVDDQLGESITQLAAKRFMRITHAAVALLILTGAWNWYVNVEVYREADKLIHMLLGIKILLAIAIFVIIFASATKVIKGNPARWAWINITLATIIIILAAIVRDLRLDAMG